MAEYYKRERTCDECGSQFWGTAGANFCSSSCRSRRWRAQRVLDRSRALAETCEMVFRLSRGGSASYSKLLIRLLRLTAAELRRRGWDPQTLLSGSPNDPVTSHDDAPGGIEGVPPDRIKRMHSPAAELELLEEAIEQYEKAQQNGSYLAIAYNGIEWHRARHAALLAKLKRG